MRPRPSSFLQSLCLFALCLLPAISPAQQPAIQPRITEALDEASTTVLRGNVHPLARVQSDSGIAPSRFQCSACCSCSSEATSRKRPCASYSTSSKTSPRRTSTSGSRPTISAGASAPPIRISRRSPHGFSRTVFKSARSARDAPSLNSPAPPPWCRTPFARQSIDSFQTARRTGRTIGERLDSAIKTYA